jgi:hypothetical protein
MQLPGDISTCGATAGVFAQPRPTRDIGWIEILQRSNLLRGRCVLSFDRKHRGCCLVADLRRNARPDTREDGMTRIASYCCQFLASPSRAERRGHRLGRPDRSERLSPFPPEASSTLWRVWSASSSRASSVSRWSLKIAAVREQRSPPPLSQSQILMDIPSW